MSDLTTPYESPSRPLVRARVSAKHSGRRFIGPIAVIGALMLPPAALLYIIARPAVDRSLLSRVALGMSRTQVSTILGPPHDTTGLNQWEYSRWGNAGWVAIAFDDADNVIMVNDESVFP